MSSRKQTRIATAISLVIALLFLQHSLKGPKIHSDLPIDTFAKLPVQEGGRIKPLDTIARSTLLVIAGKQSYQDLETDQPDDSSTADKSITPDEIKIDASEWLTELMLNPSAASNRKVFRIDHPDIVGLLGAHNEERKYFSAQEIAPHIDTLFEQMQLIPEDSSQQNSYDRALLKLRNAISLYDSTAYALVPPGLFGNPVQDYQTLIQVVKDRQTKSDASSAQTIQHAWEMIRQSYGQIQNAQINPIPASDENGLHQWIAIGENLLEATETGQIHPVAMLYAELAVAYRNQDIEAFTERVNRLDQLTQSEGKEALAKRDFEYFFNRFAPFAYSMALYILVLICAGASWLICPKGLARAALVLIIAAFLVHSFGIWARMDIQGRPPVTNLYSSAIFVGWAAVGFCILFEAIYRNGLGSAAGALVGFPTLIIAHHLSMTGDTMEMMRAVLDSNFWLATHVPVVTLGYALTFLAGILGALYIFLSAFPQGLDQEDRGKTLERMVYGVVCAALLCSFVGTVLGGIWADQSWGRFWGWDPKENGALMIVLWNALILHARWAKIAKAMGLMQLTLVGNIITAWSWFGTNMLGVGLHSYGFMDSAFLWLITFILSQCALILFGFAFQSLKSRKKHAKR